MKFTDAGEVHAEVALLSQENSRSELKFSVTDTGIGISEDQRLGLFEPFRQAESSTSRKFGGTGLGLTIARHLTELMGGTIWVDSEIGVGSTFHFTVKLENGGPSPDDSSGAMFASGKHVLILSQKPLFCQSMKAMIADAGGTGTCVENPEKAIVFLRSHSGIDGICINTSPGDGHGSQGTKWAHTIRAQSPELPIFLFRNIGDRIDDPVFRECFPKPLKRATIQKIFVGIGLGSVRRAATIAKPQPDRSPAPSKNVRILVVEDNIVNQKVAQRLLQRLGYQPTTVPGGNEAIEAIGETAFDIVLMDIQMPGMDGFEATEAIRSMEILTRQPYIVALTANARAEDRDRCLQAGMNDYVSKPIDPEELRAVIGRALQEHRTLNVNPV